MFRNGFSVVVDLEEDPRLERPFDLALAAIRGGRRRNGKMLLGTSESESVIISITPPFFCIGKAREAAGEGETGRRVRWGVFSSFFFLGDFFSRSCESDSVDRLIR